MTASSNDTTGFTGRNLYGYAGDQPCSSCTTGHPLEHTATHTAGVASDPPALYNHCGFRPLPPSNPRYAQQHQLERERLHYPLQVDANGYYHTEANDTLSTIAQRTIAYQHSNMSLRQMEDAYVRENQGTYPDLACNRDYIAIGWRLKVPGGHVASTYHRTQRPPTSLYPPSTHEQYRPTSPLQEYGTTPQYYAPTQQYPQPYALTPPVGLSLGLSLGRGNRRWNRSSVGVGIGIGGSTGYGGILGTQPLPGYPGYFPGANPILNNGYNTFSPNYDASICQQLAQEPRWVAQEWLAQHPGFNNNACTYNQFNSTTPYAGWGASNPNYNTYGVNNLYGSTLNNTYQNSYYQRQQQLRQQQAYAACRRQQEWLAQHPQYYNSTNNSCTGTYNGF